MSDEAVVEMPIEEMPIEEPKAKKKSRSTASGKVFVGCMMHHGLNLNLDNKSIILNGQNTVESLVITRFARGYTGEPGVTILDASVWEALSKKYAKFHPFTAGLVFAADSAAELQAKSKDMRLIKTGAEQKEVIIDAGVKEYKEGK